MRGSTARALLLATLGAWTRLLALQPPAPDTSGWLTRGPTGAPPALIAGTPVARSVPLPLSATAWAAALALPPSDTPRGAASLDIGLETRLPAAANDLLAETARGLDYNWLRCYLFVRDQIRFTPYFGLARGPERTLLDREGNDADQAFLLLALLRASGYDATVYHDPAFAVPITGAADGYDATSWLGVSAGASLYDTCVSLYEELSPSGIDPDFYAAGYMELDHFFVVANIDGSELPLDPSFKPRRLTSPRASLLADMGYSRTNLQACVGGTLSNGWFAQSLSSAGLSNELCRLATNLAAAWRAAGTNAAARDFIGGDELVPQDIASDTSVIHGYWSYDCYDFLAAPAYYINYFRAELELTHGELAVGFWLDEVGGRGLWLSYTNAPASGATQAVLRVDDTWVASEPDGPATSNVTAQLAVFHPAVGGWMSSQYMLARAVTNVYALPLGFGVERRGGLRDRAAETLARLRAAGLPEAAPRLRAGVLHAVGQQWLAQTAQFNELNSRLNGHPQHTFYNVGIVGQSGAPYVDFKNHFTYSSAAPSQFDTGALFDSALEHGVLDQVHGAGRPAVSTVRIVDLANAANTPLFFATASDWTAIRGSLVNYDADVLELLDARIANGDWLLLPQNGLTTLGHWSGLGYIGFGPVGGYGAYRTSMMISGDLNGGFTTEFCATDSRAVLDSQTRRLHEAADRLALRAADPVDLISGAAILDRADLGIAGPTPLAWTRHYDSRQSGRDGPLGRGWSHGYDGRITLHADLDALLGEGSPAACAASVVASAVARDLLEDGASARNLVAACLVAKWWEAQALDGAATVTAAGRALSFTRLPDGSYEPAPGVTATLTRDITGAAVMRERLGRVWTFAAQGPLSRVADASGNCVALAYGDEGAFSSETDPTGIVTVRNHYNALGQVTNQLSAAGQPWNFAFAAGVQTWESDPLQGRRYHGFTADGRLAWRSDRDGGVSTFAYDGQGQLRSRVDAVGRVTLRDYDISNRLVRVTEAANTTDARATAFVYDDRHRLSALTNALGLVTRFAYDACDRLTATTFPDGSVVSNAWDTRGLPAGDAVLDAAGRPLRSRAFTYDAAGRPDRTTATDSGETDADFDAAGNLVRFADAHGHAATFAYDARGLLTNAADAAGNPTRRGYDARGLPANIVDALGHATTFSWTPSGEPAAIRYADGGVVTNEYDAADRLAAVTEPRGRRVDYERDVMGRLTRRQTSVWQERYWYDAAGCVTTALDAVSARTEIGYDWLDRPIVTRDALGRDWQTAFDALDRVTATTDPRARSRHYGYDAMGRRITTLRPSGAVEGSAYDALGRQTAFTNAEGRVYRMAYDAQGRLLAATNAAGEQTCRNFYDLAGNLTNRLDGAGRPTRYTYDTLDRCVETRYEDGTSESFAYDAVGNLLAASNSVATESFTYDAMNRVATAGSVVRGVAFYSQWNRDLGGRVTNILYAAGKYLKRTHDADGRLASVTDWLGHTWTFSRDGAGRLTAIQSPDGLLSTNTYDLVGQLAGWSVGTVAGRTISRDAAGVKTEEQVTAGLFPNPQSPRRAANTFDAADRLVSATVVEGTNTYEETYAHDRNGAVTNIVAGTQAVLQLAYNAQQQMSAISGSDDKSFGYDALGNRLIWGDRLFLPDHADPLKRPLVEADTNGVPIRYYIWGDCTLLGFISAADGTLTVAHSDEQGSVIALTDEPGNTLYRAVYGPHGQDWGATGTNATPFAWLGGYGVQRVLDDPSLALYLTRHRLYSATLCRFLSSDPLGVGGGPNLYAYCLGNPLAYIDPLGLCASGMWYDRWGNWVQRGAEDTKQAMIAEYPWWLAGTLNTVVDIGSGFWATPQVLGHFGEGSGVFHANPSWETVPGVLTDVSTAAGVLAVGASALPSARLPIGVKPPDTVAAKSGPSGQFYSTAFQTELKVSSHPGMSRAAHFQEANGALLKSMEADAQFAQSMRNIGINLERTPTGLAPRQSPDGWTWHHAPESGVMELVPRPQHAPGSIFQETFHPGGQGGFSIWGQ